MLPRDSQFSLSFSTTPLSFPSLLSVSRTRSLAPFHTICNFPASLASYHLPRRWSSFYLAIRARARASLFISPVPRCIPQRVHTP